MRHPSLPLLSTAFTPATHRRIGLVLLLTASLARAADPLVGRWQLASQEMEGRATAKQDLLLRITPLGQTLEFSYSTPVNEIQLVTLHFAGKPDGSLSDVNDASGKKIGTVRITKVNDSQLKILLDGENRPPAAGTITVSADGKTLTSESESKPPGQPTAVQVVQVFVRQ